MISFAPCGLGPCDPVTGKCPDCQENVCTGKDAKYGYMCNKDREVFCSPDFLSGSGCPIVVSERPCVPTCDPKTGRCPCQPGPCDAASDSGSVCLDSKTSVACKMSDGCRVEVDGSLTQCPKGCDPDTGRCKGCPSDLCTQEGWPVGPHCNGDDLVICGVEDGCSVVASTTSCPLGCDEAENQCKGCPPSCSGRTCGFDPCNGDECGDCDPWKTCDDGGQCVCKPTACDPPGTKRVCQFDTSYPCTSLNGCPALASGQGKYCGAGKCDSGTGTCFCNDNPCKAAGDKKTGMLCADGALYKCSEDDSGCPEAAKVKTCVCNADGTGCAQSCLACGVNAECVFLECKCHDGWENCDKDFVGAWTLGCEVDLQNDSKNCGACNKPCTTGQMCSGGKCVPTDPTVTFDPIDLPFGEISNQTTKPLFTYVKNLTGEQASFDCTTSSGDVTAFAWGCPPALTDGQGWSMGVTFKPPNKQTTASYSASVTVKWKTATHSNQKTLTFTGTAVAQSMALMVDPPKLEFGKVLVGDTKPLTIEVSLKGDGAIPTPTVTTDVPPQYDVWNYCNNVGMLRSTGPQACSIKVEFTPTDAVSYSGSLKITSQKLGQTLTVPISGTGGKDCTDLCTENETRCTNSTTRATCQKQGLCFNWVDSICADWTNCDPSNHQCVACGGEGLKCCSDPQCKSGLTCNSSMCQSGNPCAGYQWNCGLKAEWSAPTGSVALSWKKEDLQYDTCVDSYAILRKVNIPPESGGLSNGCSPAEVNSCLVGTTSDTTMTDSKIQSGKTYRYLLYPMKGGKFVEPGGVPMLPVADVTVP